MTGACPSEIVTWISASGTSFEPTVGFMRMTVSSGNALLYS